MTLANAHPIFVGLRNDPSFLAQLEIEDDERRALMSARTEVRASLRAASGIVEKQTRFWKDSYLLENNYRVRNSVTVKFLTQGSFAYETLNAPAKPQKQEIDLDDGMYVPVTFLKDNTPALTAQGLFMFVEETLAELCKKKNWALDTSKNTCVRVNLWKGAHIDIPIYSVPENRFQLMTEAIAKSTASISFAGDNIPEVVELPSHLVMLAQRDGGWIQSDPKQLHDWVMARHERYGPVYRRLCRFFKGWRDHVWDNSPLSSICLMRAIDMAISELGGRPVDDRDDELIMQVAQLLPEIFQSNVNNPVVEGASFNDWSSADQKQIIDKAQSFSNEMTTALEQTGDAERVVQKLRSEFGDRIPYRPDAIKITNNEISSIRHAKPATVAAPKVISSTSG